MLNPLPTIVFVLLAIAGFFVTRPMGDAIVANTIYAAWLAASLIVASSFRVAAQWEKALIFRLGRFRALKGPGVFSVLPLLESVRLVDTRILTLDIPTQQAITKDNVPVSL